MREIIDRYIRGSIGGDIYDKAIDCLLALRESCISEDEAPTFNKFMEQLKERYSTGQHRDFFQMLVKRKLSLITCYESELSSIVTPQEAEQFLTEQSKAPTKQAVQINQKKQNDLDLLE